MAEIGEKKSKAEKLGERVIYVEPNDIYGDINGVPVTPDYTDYCISVNLIAEIPARHKISGGNGNTTTEVVGVYGVVNNVGEPGEGNNSQWISFLKGEDVDKFSAMSNAKDANFLSTYYTELDYDNLLKENQVEGLGIESVNIAFESYYTPTITIKFVDVRGISLFGPEERRYNSRAERNEEKNKKKGEEKVDAGSVFRAFFTLPYPKFRLQVKGYYGKAVTYQLTCSGFKTVFNSQTGNFESTATFLGYQYSLLTDIPFQYLLAAPYCTYYGEKYWNDKVGSAEWRLSNGSQPITLRDLLKEIKSALDAGLGTPGEIADKYSDEMNNIINQLDLMQGIKSNVGGLRDKLRAANNVQCKIVEVSGNVSDTSEKEHNQFLIFSTSDTITLSDVAKQCEMLRSNCNASDSIACDGSINTFSANGEINLTDLFVLDVNSVRIKNKATAEIASTDTTPNLTNASVAKINSLIATYNNDAKNPDTDVLRQYLYVFDMGTVEETANSNIDKSSKRKREIEETIASEQKAYSVDVLQGVRPCMGDIFKILMCHLETFIAMVWVCYREICDEMNNSQRTPSLMGVNLEETDITGDEGKGTTQIYPWPGIFRHGSVGKDGGKYDSSSRVWTWPDEVKGTRPFKECEFITKLLTATKYASSSISNNFTSGSMLTGFPILPNDLNNKASIFDNCNITGDVSAIAGYLSFRMSQIFGVFGAENGGNEKFSSNDCTAFGKMDGYNLYMSLGGVGKDAIKQMLENTNTGEEGTFEKLVMSIAKCDKSADKYGICNDNGDSKQMFETCKAINGRHPMFSGDKYVHFFTSDKVGIVPDNLTEFTIYKQLYDFPLYKKGNDIITRDAYNKLDDRSGYTPLLCFNPLFKGEKDSGYMILNNHIYATSTEKLINSVYFDDNGTAITGDDLTNKREECLDRYLNPNMFSVNTNNQDVLNVIDRYEKISEEGTITVNGEEFDVSFDKETVDKVFHDDFYEKYFKTTSPYLSNRIEGEKWNELARSVTGAVEKTPEPETETKLNPSSRDNNWGGQTNVAKLTGNVVQDKETEKKDKEVNPPTANYLGWLNSQAGSGNLIYPSKDNEGQIDNAIVRNVWYENWWHIGEGVHTVSLFGDAFYYLQNSPIKGETNPLRKNCVKALLFLTASAKYGEKGTGYKFCDYKGGVNVAPYGTVLLDGAWLWRRRYIEQNDNTDPIIFGAGDGLNYKTLEGKNSTFLKVNLPQKIDKCIENALINEFLEFVNGGLWEKIRSRLELNTYTLNKDGKQVCREFYTNPVVLTNGKKLNERTFIGFWKALQAVRENKFYSPYKSAVDYKNGILNEYIYGGVNGFYSQYDYIGVKGTNDYYDIQLLNQQNDAELQNALKDVYMRKAIVNTMYSVDGFNKLGNGDGSVIVTADKSQAYLKGFVDTLKAIIGKKSAPVDNENVSNDVDVPEDNLLPMYIYVKNLWDRWLVSTPNKRVIPVEDKLSAGEVRNYNDSNSKFYPYNEYYNVKPFFDNFVFIDAFYRNIYKDFLINPNVLLRKYVERADDASLYQYIGDILKEHKCMFLALPDYVAMGSEGKAIENMELMFTPMAYNNMNDVEAENKFIVIYLPRASEVPSSANGFRNDNYHFYDPTADQDIAEDMPATYKMKPYNSDEDNTAVTRYGYYVPSFGVAFSRQNNHLFKNISLDMSTPLVTSAVASTLTRIMEDVGGNKSKVTLMGQDVYPVFSNYSYQCEIEMMGDAQIQPLMYFQLMNIPMWNGVYMIFNVTHNIAAGNFITRFKGMKLSKNALPYSKIWYRPNADVDTSTDSSGGSADSSGSAGGYGEYSAGGPAPRPTPMNNMVGIQYAKGNPGYYPRMYHNPANVRPASVMYEGQNGSYQAGKAGTFAAFVDPYYSIKAAVSSNKLPFNKSREFMINQLPTISRRNASYGHPLPANVDPQALVVIMSRYCPFGDGGNNPYIYAQSLVNQDKSAFSENGIYTVITQNTFNENVKIFTAIVRGIMWAEQNTRVEDWYMEMVWKAIYHGGVAPTQEYLKHGQSVKPESTGDGKYVPMNYPRYRYDIQPTSKNGVGYRGKGKPVLVGDSWAVGMSDKFRNDYGGVSIVVPQTQKSQKGTVRVGAPISEVTERLQWYLSDPKNDPAFIVAYCGLNSWFESEETLIRLYKALANAATAGDKKYIIYIARVAYVNKAKAVKGTIMKNDVDKLNSAIIKSCSGNSVYLDYGVEQIQDGALHPRNCDARGNVQFYPYLMGKIMAACPK